MKIHELQSQIARQGLASLYLVIGEEPYFRDQVLTVIHEAVQSSPDFGKGDEPSTPECLGPVHCRCGVWR